jgi:hypothetical protein
VAPVPVEDEVAPRSPPGVRVEPTPPWPVGWLDARLSDPSRSDSGTPCRPDEPVPLPRPPRPPEVVELEPRPVPVAPVPEARPEGPPVALIPVPVPEPYSAPDRVLEEPSPVESEPIPPDVRLESWVDEPWWPVKASFALCL